MPFSECNMAWLPASEEAVSNFWPTVTRVSRTSYDCYFDQSLQFVQEFPTPRQSALFLRSITRSKGQRQMTYLQPFKSTLEFGIPQMTDGNWNSECIFLNPCKVARNKYRNPRRAFRTPLNRKKGKHYAHAFGDQPQRVGASTFSVQTASVKCLCKPPLSFNQKIKQDCLDSNSEKRWQLQYKK